MNQFQDIPRAAEIESIVRSARATADEGEVRAIMSGITTFAQSSEIERGVGPDWLFKHISSDPTKALDEISYNVRLWAGHQD